MRVLRKIRLYILINRISTFILFLSLVLSTTIVLAESSPKLHQKTPFQSAVEAIHNLPTDSLSINAIPYCRRYTCYEVIDIQIAENEWEEATYLLSEKPRTARMERAILTEVFSRIEILLGRITKTQYDIGGTFKVDKLPQANSLQLDCVDEAFNMYVFLNLLKNQGRLYWHDVEGLVHRGWLFDLNYPHTAISMIDKNTHEKFVIDSWFHDNGRPPELISLQEWKSGWTPAGF